MGAVGAVLERPACSPGDGGAGPCYLWAPLGLGPSKSSVDEGAVRSRRPRLALGRLIWGRALAVHALPHKVQYGPAWPPVPLGRGRAGYVCMCLLV